MLDAPLDLSRARILITNDDGIHAPGLEVLETIARALSPDVWVVAPESEQSGAGHSLTLRRPLRLRQIGERRHAVDGTPTDCVLVAVQHLLQDRKPDLVLSGVNRGGNLGEDVGYSGTVSAAMEANLLGLPAIALSQTWADEEVLHWDTAATHGPDLIRRLTGGAWAEGMLINVNFPAVTPDRVRGARVCRQGRRPVHITIKETPDPRGRPCLWIGDFAPREALRPDNDLGAVAEHFIAVTPLHQNMTLAAGLPVLEAALE